jgi:omega-3 fatty acid desaturase (delta-15 desaturase)
MAASLLSRKTVCLGAGDVSVVASRFSGARTRNALRCGFKTKGLGGLELANPTRAEKLVVVRNVAAPLTLVPEPETPEVVEEEESGSEFDPARKPPFTLSDIRAAIPKHCWEKNTWKSLSYVARDVALVFALAAGAAAVNSWLLWPLYWVAQGSLF